MPPKRKPDTPSVLEAWSRLKASKPSTSFAPIAPDEVICIEESPEDAPLNSTTVNHPPVKWNATPPVQSTPRLQRNILSYTSADVLLSNGCDVSELSWMQIPLQADLVQHDLVILRSLLHADSALILPKRAISLCALFTLNWLRFFPNSRVCLCTSSEEYSDLLKTECLSLGIPPSTFSSLNCSKIPQSARILSSSSTILTRIFTSDPLAREIRAVILHIGATENFSRLKPIVHQILVKKIPCRIIVLGGGGSSGAKTGAISRRQQMITSLHIAQWIEPDELPFRSVIRPVTDIHLNVKTWKEENNAFLVKAVKSLEEGIRVVLCESPFKESLPSTDPRELIFCPFDLLSNKSSITQKASSLISTYANLLLYGKEAFDASLSEIATCHQDLQLIMMQCPQLVDALETVRTVEGEHRKTRLIKETLQLKRSKVQSLRALILTQDVLIRSTIKTILDPLCRILNLPLYELDADVPLSRASTVLHSPMGAVVILSLSSSSSINILDSLTSSSALDLVISTSRRSAWELENVKTCEHVVIVNEELEKMREISSIENERATHKRADAAWALQNYPFSLTKSSLIINTCAMNVRCIGKGTVTHWHRHDFLVNPCSMKELCTRSSSFPPSSRPLIVSPSSLLFNDSLHSPLYSPSSRRFVYLVCPPPLPPPCLCTPSSSVSFYQDLLSRLSSVF